MRNIRLVLASFLLAGACAPAQPDLSLQIADWCDAFGKTCGRSFIGIEADPGYFVSASKRIGAVPT